MSNYEVLFTPFQIGRMEVRNRIVMSPMGTNATDGDGSITDNRVDYYAERAKGGVGMIILGAQFISQSLTSGCIEGVIEHKSVLPKLSVLVEAVHRHGAKICAQLSCGVGRNAFIGRFDKPSSASAIPATLDPNVLCHALTKEEIAQIMELFTNAAQNATLAGFDAIEVHAHAGYLVDQFLSPVWNKRTDEYGGSVEGRTRFAREIVAAIKRGCRSEMPVLFRMSLDHRFPGGRTIEESLEIMRMLEEAGVDAFDVDAGSYETIDYIFPPAYLGDACMAYTAKAARNAVKVPLLNSGNHTPETAAEMVREGYADFAMFGRGLIADPELPKKLREGRREDIRPCIRCNEDCIGRTAAFHMVMLSCSVNTQACQERTMTLVQTQSPQKVCVIGAGPAGLEAARVAALCGHEVTIFEASDQIGGQLTAAYTPAFKGQLRELVKYYGVQLEKLGVVVHKKELLCADDERLTQFDKIIVATGANSFCPPIPGIDGDHVINVLDAHRKKELVKGDNIVICGGGLSGCDCAVELSSEYGKSVTIIEMLPDIAPGMIMMNKAALKRLIQENGIQVYTGCKVESVNQDGVHIQNGNGEKKTIMADTVIEAFGTRSNNQLYHALREKYGYKVRAIGDCEKVGKVGSAIRAGYFAGSTIDD